MLPGVGDGFFDDQQPETLFNLGSALVQPPTFIGSTGVGYAVTAAGDLVRFSLSDPSVGANVVFSGEQVSAAQALSTGQVVVALANGEVRSPGIAGQQPHRRVDPAGQGRRSQPAQRDRRGEQPSGPAQRAREQRGLR